MTRAEDGIRARRDLLTKAVSAFAARGFPGVSIASLADELGIAKATVLHHYPSKERLYDEVLSEIARTLEPLMVMASAQREPNARSLAEIACGYLKWARANPDCAKLLTRELLDNAERASEAKRWHLREFTKSLTALIDRGQALGTLREFESALFVEMLLGLVQFHIAANATRPHLMNKTKAKTYERALEQQLQEMVVKGFSSS
ncbi:MAG: TetR/AcrR family transcriptional regulator [Methyloversatilis sp.]|nr:TetR/AcrR family transcriptional regulator [Methyloversatilis sp.]